MSSRKDDTQLRHSMQILRLFRRTIFRLIVASLNIVSIELNVTSVSGPARQDRKLLLVNANCSTSNSHAVPDTMHYEHQVLCHTPT